MTFIDADSDANDPGRISVAADQQALLNTGSYVLLVDNRGWSQIGPPTLWAKTSIEQIAATARAVVGPLTPLDGHTDHFVEYEHWTHLAKILHAHGASITPEDLPRLPHRVVFSDRLQAQIDPLPRRCHTGPSARVPQPRQPQHATPKNTSTEHDPLFRTVPGNHDFKVKVL